MNNPNEVPIIDLRKFDKNKKWLIFYKKNCNSCHYVIKYFKTNGIKFKKYDIMTKEGLAKAAECQIIEECTKWIPVIILDKEYN